MTSEIRANSITSRAGMSTVTMTDSGPMFSGITTFVDNSGFTFGVGGGTSIFTPATNVLTFGTNNTEKIRIDASGHMHGVGVVTATHFYGDGSNLTNLPAQATIANNGNDRIITGGSGKNLNGEANLQFDGTDLYVSDKIKHLGDPDTFMEFGNNTISFDTAGSERLRIDSGGNMGVGNANPTQAKLVVENSSGNTIAAVKSGNAGAVALGGPSQPRILMEAGQSSSDLLIYTAGGSSWSSPSWSEKFRIKSDGRFGFNTSSPSDYALATFNSTNGILLQGSGQSRILMRNNTGGTNEKMMDIQCNGNINFRTINDDYTTATTRATFRTDGNFVVGNRVGTNSPSTNQPVAFHSARVTPDTASSTLSNGVRCNLYVGSNTGWQSGDGGVIGMGGSRAGYAGQEAMWAYIKGSRISGNGWEYAGKMELGTAEWGTYNTTKAVTIYADNQIDHHGKDNTMYSASIGGAVRVRLQHNGGGNMTISNPSSGNFTFDTNSDYRLKENVVNITNALTTVKALKPYQYKWKHDGKLGQGFIAHEAQEVLPDVGIVSGTKDAVHAEDDPEKGHWKKDDPIYQGIDYSKLVPLLTAALQELDTKVETLSTRVETLEQENITLRTRVTNLEGN